MSLQPLPLLSFEHTRRVMLITLFSVLAAASTLPYVFVFSGPLRFLSFISIGALAAFVACVVLNRMGYYRLARYTLLVSANLYIFTTASTFGRETGEQLIFLPILFGAVLVFDFSEKISLGISIAFTLTCLIVLELTDYSLLHVPTAAREKLQYYYGNLIVTFVSSVVIALFYFRIYARQNIKNEDKLFTAQNTEHIISYFSTSLYGKNTEDEIFWDVARNCIARLGFEDCVVYVVDEKNKKLIQKAAYGAKNSKAFEIDNALEIPLGEGIVGTVAVTGIAEIIADTSQDRRYIVDDQARASEITVPILYHNKVIGVIDSEHAQKDFFNATHLNVLHTIAALCSNKVIKARAEEEKIQATIAKLEADKVIEVDKVKSRFFTNISHEFRTPLTLILAPLDEMIHTEQDADNLKQLKMMQASARKLLRLINDLLELSKLDEGMLTLEPVRDDVFAFLRTVATSFQSQATSHGINFQIHIPSYALIIAFDQSKIETIVANLLSTALAFTPPAGAVVLTAMLQNDNVEIRVSNTHHEITNENLDKVFDSPFIKTDGLINDISGIGLSLSKQLALLHHGNLLAETNFERGNTFTLTIPAEYKIDMASKPAPSTARDEPIASAQHHFVDDDKKPLVLLVEDNNDLRNYLKSLLQSAFTLIEATNGEEGMQRALQNVPDLVISDVMMPIQDGLAFCKTLKATEVTSHIPVLLLTAKADMNSKLEGLETGADYYLTKPFQTRELITVATNLITQRKKLKEQFSKTVLLKSESWKGKSADDKFLEKLMNQIEAHFSDADFTVEELQKELGISRMQLHRKLKALTDLSATEFIRSMRLKRAAAMLEQGYDNVSQVAYQVGFNNLSYFSKCFKEQYGSLPSAFARKNTSS